MKKGLQIIALLLISITPFAQVTQINSNKSLQISFPLTNSKTILTSDIDKTLWVTDATTGGTFQSSSTVKYEDGGGLMNNKFIFPGRTTATGTELWITDGTVAGTSLLKDINPGTESSLPDDDFSLLNGYLYFTAVSPGMGRELWRTDGTTAGTTLVKDIIPGAAGSSTAGNYELFSTGTYLLLRVPTLTEGLELWKSDGTESGTVLLKDINPGTASSSPKNFYLYNNIVLFIAKDEAHGTELWKTDGTASGTQLVKDIKEGTGSSVSFLLFYPFKGKAYFIADNGVAGDEIWSTDGTTENTKLLKDIQPNAVSSYPGLFSAVNMGDKLIFTAFTANYDVELWESDGSTEGTKLFKELADGLESGAPYLFTPFSFTAGQTPLFQGNKFFFMMVLPSSGAELWICDGTPEGTKPVKSINPDEKSFLSYFSYTYTSSGLLFAANDGVYGVELWKSDGTSAGTQRITDINPGIEDADIFLSFFPVNNKIVFQATNGDHQTATDLYVLEGEAVMPVKLLQFTVEPKTNDALLQWSTAQEINSKDFTVERSLDGKTFSSIGMVKAAGSSSGKKEYSFTDNNIINSGKEIVYYRLQMNDKDGTSSTTKVVSIKLKGNTTWNMKLVNNPVASTLKLELNGLKENVQLSIKDVSGKTLYNAGIFTSNGLVNVSADRLTPGIYLLVAETGSERKAIRFVKQ